MTQNSTGDIRIPKWTWLLAGVFLLHFVPALFLEISYGPSYNFMSIDNRWAPNDSGGWKAIGFPQTIRPSEPSVNVPLFLRIIPFVLPALLVLLFLTGPLSKYAEKEADFGPSKYNPEEYKPEFIDEMPKLEDEEEPIR